LSDVRVTEVVLFPYWSSCRAL